MELTLTLEGARCHFGRGWPEGNPTRYATSGCTHGQEAKAVPATSINDTSKGERGEGEERQQNQTKPEKTCTLHCREWGMRLFGGGSRLGKAGEGGAQHPFFYSLQAPFFLKPWVVLLPPRSFYKRNKRQNISGNFGQEQSDQEHSAFQTMVDSSKEKFSFH